MDYKKTYASLKKKYKDDLIKKAIKQVDYDLAQHDKSRDDISSKKYEAMIATNIEKIKSNRVNRVLKTGWVLTGIPFVINMAKGNFASAFGFGDDEEDVQ